MRLGRKERLLRRKAKQADKYNTKVFETKRPLFTAKRSLSLHTSWRLIPTDKQIIVKS